MYAGGVHGHSEWGASGGGCFSGVDPFHGSSFSLDILASQMQVKFGIVPTAVVSLCSWELAA